MADGRGLRNVFLHEKYYKSEQDNMIINNVSIDVGNDCWFESYRNIQLLKVNDIKETTCLVGCPSYWNHFVVFVFINNLC